VRRLVLVRHGESRWNAEARIQGQRCEGLSDVGHAQAKVTAAALAATYPDAVLVSSDLQRTVETAAPLAEALDQQPRLDARLRERSFGAWEGRLRAEVIAADPGRWQRWLDGEDVVGEVGGEYAHELAARVEPVLRELLAATPAGGVTIAVTHGGPVWHGTHRVLDLPAGTLGAVGNTSVTELVTFDDGAVVLDRWNELAHLPVELRVGWIPSVHGAAAGEAAAAEDAGGGDAERSGDATPVADHPPAPPVGR
jgi:glucosyl-3-phosphoglycerate phosphatase